MYSYEKMPGSLGALGLGMPDFHSYWAAVKDKIADIQALGPKISAYQQRIAVAQQTLIARGGTWVDTAHQLDDELRKIQDDLDKWWKVKGFIDTWLPQWMSAADDATTQVQGMGFIVLAVAGIAALAYVVTTGLALYEDYKYKTGLTQDVIEQKLTSGQAAEILSVPPVTGIGPIDGILQKIGMGLGFGVPTALLVGGGVYFLYSSGMLNDVMSKLGLNKPSSTPSV